VLCMFGTQTVHGIMGILHIRMALPTNHVYMQVLISMQYFPGRRRGTWDGPLLEASCITVRFHK
jgi:hypothetical protein